MSQRDPEQRRAYMRARAAALRGDRSLMDAYRARNGEHGLAHPATDEEIAAAIAAMPRGDERCVQYEQQGGWRVRCFFDAGHRGQCVFRRTA